MWCTQCQVAFSWTSGKIIRGNQIHNPHYYQALQAGNINVARNPGDQICGGLLPHQISNKFRSFSKLRLTAIIKIEPVITLLILPLRKNSLGTVLLLN